MKKKHLQIDKSWPFIGALLLLFTVNVKAQVVQTYSYTGSVQSFTVPTCVTSISVECYGGKGETATSGAAPGTGGLGAYVGGILNVVQGDVLSIFVGGQGASGTGGYNGGGNGGTIGAGGGGGASDIRLNGVALANRVIVAGGGGGGGSTGCVAAHAGGNGGNGGGFPGQAGTDSPNGGGGFGGTLNAGGAAGIGCGGFLGSPGTVPNGGNGQGCCCALTPGGGGGGGGFVQGGGGGGGSAGTTGCSGNDKGGGGGGAGGSNYLAGVSSGYTLSNTQTTVGLVRITYYACCPSIMASMSNGAGTCPGTSVTLMASGVSTYTWLNTGANTQNIVVSPNATTIYTVSGTNANGCVSSALLVVNVNPAPSLTLAASNTFVCSGQSTTLTASGASTYTWVSTSGSIGSGTSVVVSPTLSPLPNASNYTATGTSTAGCVSTAEIYITVNPLELTITSNTMICKGKSVVLNVSGAVGSYNWSNNIDNANSPFQNYSPSPTVTTIYTASGLDANNCILTKTVSVVVNQNPTVLASTSKTLVCKGQPITISASGADTYSWSTTGTSPTITVTPVLDIFYNYVVTGTDANGCTGTATVLVKAEPCTGIAGLPSSKNQVSIFPNPNHGLFHVEVPAGPANRSIIIYSASGALIKKIELVSQDIEIDLQKEPAGIYFVHLLEGNKDVSVSKIIKE